MAGWEEVLGEIVRTRHRALVGYAYLLSGDMREAEDLVQEALARTFARGRRARDFQLAEGYVRTAITNVFLDGTRKAKQWRGVSHLLAGADSDAGSIPAVSDRVDVQQALQSLPPRQRACVVLRYFHDHTVPEIADQLSLSPGTVKRYLHEAHAALAQKLGPVQEPGGVLPVTPRGGHQ